MDWLFKGFEYANQHCGMSRTVLSITKSVASNIYSLNFLSQKNNIHGKKYFI